MANPNCPDKGSAERAVNEVWESCFNDTRPFDEVCIAYFLTCSPFFTQNSRYINTLAPYVCYYYSTEPLQIGQVLHYTFLTRGGPMIMAFCITIITCCGLNELCFVYVLMTLTGYLVFAPFASSLVRSCSHILHRPHDHCPFSTTPPPFMRFYSIPQSARFSLQCARRRSLSLGLTPSFSLLSNSCFNLTSIHSPHLLCLQ